MPMKVLEHNSRVNAHGFQMAENLGRLARVADRRLPMLHWLLRCHRDWSVVATAAQAIGNAPFENGQMQFGTNKSNYSNDPQLLHRLQNDNRCAGIEKNFQALGRVGHEL